MLYDVNRTQSCDLEAENGEKQIHIANHSSASTLASLDLALMLYRAMGPGFERLLSFRKMMKTYFGVLSIGLRSKNEIRERQELVQQRWNNMLPVFCVITLSLDPLFCYLLVFNNETKCIGLDKILGAMVIVLRFFVDFFYVLYIIYRFRASVVSLSSQSSSESKVNRFRYSGNSMEIFVVLLPIRHTCDSSTSTGKDSYLIEVPTLWQLIIL